MDHVALPSSTAESRQAAEQCGVARDQLSEHVSFTIKCLVSLKHSLQMWLHVDRADGDRAQLAGCVPLHKMGR